MSWVKTKDKLPPDSMTVLIFEPFSDNGIYLGSFEHTEGWSREYLNEITAVTHWMPLPTEPLENE